MRPSFLVAAALTAVTHVDAKGVFAHFMLGNSNNYTHDNWRTDISAAKDAKIDAFAINTGWGMPGTFQLLDDAFSVAKDMDFKLFMSLDYSGDGHWPQDKVIYTLQNYTTHPAYYRTSDGKPLVSTFEGAQAGGDWQHIKKKVDCAFIPDWSSLEPDVAIGRGDVDGLMSWDAWPNGTSQMTTDEDKKYLAVLKDKPYVMPVSPWFYSNLLRLNKNWVWQGDDLWYTRWQQVLEVDPEYVEIISWNDWGESHYIGPIHDDDMDVFSYGNAPFNYAKGMPHDGWRAFLPYVIDQYKNGGNDANIDKEGVVAWYRTTPASACGSGKTTGNTETQNQDILKPGEVLQDKIFYSALLESSADISVSIGGKNRTGRWENTPAGGRGIYHGSIPMEQELGDVVVTLSRDGRFLATIRGHAISTNCVNNVTNWNAWVGSTTSTAQNRGSTSSSSSGQDESSSTRVLLAGVTPVILGWTAFLLLM
ncbi:conserved hypothetical protein [Aspergillus terreus NIH2624]|uniref:Glycoside hydrolase n=1 Tax=Aspergillus terreus (strain NIH 2624 / FGSC A1156) TaxID=341663 RepID=Q0CEV6_ASPTN|nr:uncharacterized protein ATEG_07778 [Aspergillus terreus NIH2624]EAU32040.1 conserved hypothetical protein [Aspergillus terreus NIH2624]